MTCSVSPDTVKHKERGPRAGRGATPGCRLREGGNECPRGSRPWRDSQARTAESLLPLLLFLVPWERHPGGLCAVEHGAERPRLRALWSRCPWEGWDPGQQAAILCLAHRSAAPHPRRRRELSPAAGPGDFSSIGGTVSTHGPGRESFSLSRVR